MDGMQDIARSYCCNEKFNFSDNCEIKLIYDTKETNPQLRTINFVHIGNFNSFPAIV